VPSQDHTQARAVVLVHGAGHTGDVWDTVREHLQHPSVAPDLPGRRNRPAPLAEVTIDEAAASLAADVERATDARVILVGHSAGGVVLPALAARLHDRVDHLVFVAGLCARDGERVITTVRPDAEPAMVARLQEMRAEFPRGMLDPDAGLDGVTALDEQTAMPIDSLNYMSQPVSWRGVPAGLDRTFVRPLRDRIQPRELQEQLIEHCGATTVVDLDCGHTPALARPAELATILDSIAGARVDT
jgi:pimeloyl-ACP methyl ester carboxylesterase